MNNQKTAMLLLRSASVILAEAANLMGMGMESEGVEDGAGRAGRPSSRAGKPGKKWTPEQRQKFMAAVEKRKKAGKK